MTIVVHYLCPIAYRYEIMWSDLAACEGRKCWDAANLLSDRPRTVSHLVKHVAFYPVFPAAVCFLPLLDAHQLVSVPVNRCLISQGKMGIHAINLCCVTAISTVNRLATSWFR